MFSLSFLPTQQMESYILTRSWMGANEHSCRHHTIGYDYDALTSNLWALFSISWFLPLSIRSYIYRIRCLYLTCAARACFCVYLAHISLRQVALPAFYRLVGA